jgi:carboxypeptidase family protein
MKLAMRLFTLLAIAALAYDSTTVSAATTAGSIRGFIKDPQGNPLVGAVVCVMPDTEEAKAEKVVKRAATDKEGKFIAAGILPGRYRVKAEAIGFKPVEMAADVLANKVTIFDSILMRRIGTLAEETSLNLDPRHAARRASGTIFQHNDSEKKPADAEETVAAADNKIEVHGAVQAFSQSGAGSAGDPGSFLGANFAVSEQLSSKVSLMMGGQVGYGERAPQRLEAITTAHAGERHRLSVALGYGRFTFSRRGGLPKLGQFTLSATDTWQVSGPVLVVYGLEFSRFTEGTEGTSVLPRLGVAIDATARTRLFAGVVPGSSVDEQSKVNLESGEIVFSEPKPVALAPGNDPVMDRSYRLQLGGEQVLSDKSSVEMMAFFDTISGHGVGLLAIPVEGNRGMRTERQTGRARGMRVVYHRRLNDVIEGSVGYAFGEGQRLDPRGITTPAQMFDNQVFHVFSAKIDANFVGTGTRVSTVLRLAPEQAVFAIDPFQGQIATYDPNLSLSLTQELPDLGFLPGHWQAMIDLRNLLDQQASVADERQELVVSRYNRLIRIGVSLRF